MFAKSSISFSISKARSANDDNLIPLINIVFLLLIFFMVAGKIAQKDITEIEAPKTQAKASAIESEQTIIIDSLGTLWIGSDAIAAVTSSDQEPVITALSTLDNSQSVVLKIDANLPAKDIDAILRILRKNKVSAIELAVSQQ